MKTRIAAGLTVASVAFGLSLPAFASGDVANDNVVDAQGRILVRTQDSGSAIWRILPNGSPDRTFGNNGTLLTAPHFFDGEYPEANSISVGSDGFFVLGVVSNGEGPSPHSVYLRHYDQDGRPDPVFGGNSAVNGIVRIDDCNFAANLFVLDSALLVNCGNPGMVGPAPTTSRVYAFTLAGEPDAAFADGQGVLYNVLPWGLSRDNRFFGISADNTVRRYFANGDVDPSFQAFGPEPMNWGTAEQVDGKVLFVSVKCGDDGCVVYVHRVRADGTADPTFGQSGTASIPIANVPFVAALSVPPSGEISVLLNDYVFEDNMQKHIFATVVRLRPDGSIDSGFADGGFARLKVSPADNEWTVGGNIRSDDDGGVIIFGASPDYWSVPATRWYSFAAKLDALGRLDAGFGSSGLARVGI